jgi:hypothetical protein
VSAHASSSTVTQVAQNSVFERLARAGYIVSGLLHLTIGYLAIRIALAAAPAALTNPGRSRQWPPNRAASSRSGSPRSRSW